MKNQTILSERILPSAETLRAFPPRCVSGSSLLIELKASESELKKILGDFEPSAKDSKGYQEVFYLSHRGDGFRFHYSLYARDGIFRIGGLKKGKMFSELVEYLGGAKK